MLTPCTPYQRKWRNRHKVLSLISLLSTFFLLRILFEDHQIQSRKIDFQAKYIQVSGSGAQGRVYSFPSANISLKEIVERSGIGRLCLYTQSGIHDIFIPSSSLIKVSSTATGQCNLVFSKMSGTTKLALDIPVNPNRAKAIDLQAIPYIGPSLSKKLIQYRQKHGPFSEIKDLIKVRGVGVKLLNRIRRYISIGKER